MGWRDVQRKINSGELSYAPSGMDTFFASASTSFRKYYTDALESQADALKKTKELEAENDMQMKAALRLSKEILGSDDKAAVAYAYNVIKDYEGNVGQATERLESLSDAERLEIVPSGSFGALNSDLNSETLDLFTMHESGSGGYDALLGQAQDTEQFRDVKITEMTMDQVLDFVSPGGAYSEYSLGATVPGQEAYENGRPSTPVGKFQFVGKTLRDIRDRGGFEELGITGTTLYDEDTQNKLFAWYVKDTMNAASGDKAAYREKMRNRFEGFRKKDKNGEFVVTDKQLDDIHAKVKDGQFTTGKVSNVDAPNRFDVGKRLGEITGRDEEALIQIEQLKAEILAEGYDLTDDQNILITNVEEEIKKKIKENGFFKRSEFLEENRLTSKEAVTAAISVVDSMDISQFKGAESEKAEHLTYLTEIYNRFEEKEIEENKNNTDADRDPFVFYPRNENGALSLGGKLVVLRDGKYYEQTNPNVEVDVTNGKLTTENFDASTFIKLYNDNILKMGEIVTDGESATDILLRYRKLAYENPAAFNIIVNAANGLINTADVMASGFNTLINQGASYEEVLGKFELTENFRALSDPAKQMFSLQLQAAYSLARLNGSSGQGLSDKELAQNLEAVGFGAPNARIALSLINQSLLTVEGRTNTRAKGIRNALLNDQDYIDVVNNLPISKEFGVYMQEIVTAEGYDPKLLEQYNLAKEGSVKHVANNEDPNANIPILTRDAAGTEAWNNAPSGTKFKVEQEDGSFVIKTKP